MQRSLHSKLLQANREFIDKNPLPSILSFMF